jgi:hypothetical protein
MDEVVTYTIPWMSWISQGPTTRTTNTSPSWNSFALKPFII